MKLMRLFSVLAGMGLSLAAAPAPAASPSPGYLGRWLIAEAQAAPWSVPGDAASAPVPAGIVGQALVYERTRIAGPRLFACRRPHYRMVQVPPEGLFQGGLTAPAVQAAALGFRSPRIATLQTGCEFDFHFINARTALFALDNMVYTIRKQAR